MLLVLFILLLLFTIWFVYKYYYLPTKNENSRSSNSSETSESNYNEGRGYVSPQIDNNNNNNNNNKNRDEEKIKTNNKNSPGKNKQGKEKEKQNRSSKLLGPLKGKKRSNVNDDSNYSDERAHVEVPESIRINQFNPLASETLKMEMSRDGMGQSMLNANNVLANDRIDVQIDKFNSKVSYEAVKPRKHKHKEKKDNSKGKTNDLSQPLL